MEKSAILMFYGIKCDNPECDYRDDYAKREDYEQYVNKPCPLCGEKLLTQKDLDSVVKLEIAVGVLDEVMSTFKKVNGKILKTDIIMNGTGKIEIGKSVLEDE
jgi:hypothetical protein